MKILGIMWEENSTAALIVDGKVIAAVSQERFSRIKNDERYPKDAINYVLAEGKIKASEIDIVAFTGLIWKPYYILTRRYSTSKVEDYVREQKEYWYPRMYENKSVKYFDVFKDKLDFNQYPGDWKDVFEFVKKDDEGQRVSENEISEYFRKFRKNVVVNHLKIDPEKVVFIDHHSAHSHYAYYASPIRKNALVLTADAWGDNINATVNTVINGRFKRISESSNFSLGRLYRYITLILGMKPNEHEYKVMGLAPYAKEKYFQKVLNIFEETQYVSGLGFDYKIKPKDSYYYFRDKFEGTRFDNIAGALQKYTENLLTAWVKNAVKKTGQKSICFAGGTAMNVKANMEINKLKEVKEIFVNPCPDDTSLAIGSAYVAMSNYCEENNLAVDKAIQPLKDAYLGPRVSDEEIEELIIRNKLKQKYKITKNVKPAKVAKLLASGKVVARCADRSEFGARALGNRSIIADPRNSDVIKIINEKIKNRDFWMPFAPIVLEKRAKDYLIGYKKIGAPYMTLAFETTPRAVKDLRAGLHPYDSTCRAQVLKKDSNPKLEKIISEFEKLTGVGGLLNTSFNLHGEPIVQTAEDAFRVFKLSDLDALLLNDTLIEKK